MELTMREKEMLVMFGCENRKLTHERLGLACACITVQMRCQKLQQIVYEIKSTIYLATGGTLKCTVMQKKNWIQGIAVMWHN